MLTPGGNLSLYAQVSYIIREAVNCGAPPSMARMPITPEQVAEAYAARDAAKGQALAPRHGSERRYSATAPNTSDKLGRVDLHAVLFGTRTRGDGCGRSLVLPNN